MDSRGTGKDQRCVCLSPKSLLVPLHRSENERLREDMREQRQHYDRSMQALMAKVVRGEEPEAAR